ncbi:helix-turn-helix domain-containing protein [Desulfocurvus sp. DL9XJH121]
MATREYPQIKTAKALKPFIVHVEWTNGDVADVNVQEHVERFAKFFGPGIANRWGDMIVDDWGWFVSWGENTEIGSDLLWDINEWAHSRSMSPQAFAEWIARHNLNQIRTAEALGISPRQVQNYLKGTTPIPRTVVLALQALGQQMGGEQDDQFQAQIMLALSQLTKDVEEIKEGLKNVA